MFTDGETDRRRVCVHMRPSLTWSKSTDNYTIDQPPTGIRHPGIYLKNHVGFLSRSN